MKAIFSNSDPITLSRFFQQVSKQTFSYKELGYTQQEPMRVKGYDNDHNVGVIGQGEASWSCAKRALKEWRHFPSGWMKIIDPAEQIRSGNTVAVLFHLFGLWWINGARIVYLIDEDNKYGFAYGTLLGHIEKGEEAFWIERRADSRIEYHIRAFSRPAYPLVRLAYPLARLFQRRFVGESIQIMKSLCNEQGKTAQAPSSTTEV